jgi:hypothetical protein
MMRCHIHGIGTMSIGPDAPFADTTAVMETLPIKDYVKPKVSRRFGRLSKMIYIAGSRAIEDAEVADPTAIPIVNATCMGETNASLGLLEQIHSTKGTLISPAFVPNSVHNAPAGYLTIGLKNRAPSVTVSQGWLSSEAAVAAATDFLFTEIADEVLVLCGDECDPNWVTRLDELGASHLARAVERESLQEGAVGLVLGTEAKDADLGSIAAIVVRGKPDAGTINALLEKNGVTPGKEAEVRVRINAGGEPLRRAAAEALSRPVATVHLDGPGPGTVQAASFNALAAAARDPAKKELLVLAAEVEDLAFLHWQR